MKYITERVAYLKGLAEGLDLDTSTKEGKMISKIVEVLEEMSIAISDMDCAIDEIDSFVDSMDEDLADLEEAVYEDEDDDCDCDCCCGDEEDELDGFECESCGHIVYLDLDDFDDDEEILCPNCNAPLFEEEDEDEEEV